MKKQYLGDGVYADYDGYHVVLTTEDGVSATNTIFLEPEVLQALRDFTEELRTKSAKIHRAGIQARGEQT